MVPPDDKDTKHDCAWREFATHLQSEVEGLKARVDVLTRAFEKRSEKTGKMPKIARPPKTPEEAADRRTEQALLRAERIVTEEKRVAVPEAEKKCHVCGGSTFRSVGAGKTCEIFEYVPGYLKRIVLTRETVACRCGGCVLTAPAPDRWAEKTRYASSFVAHLVVSKCLAATPHYRLEQAFARTGVSIARSTINDLFRRAGQKLEPSSRGASTSKSRRSSERAKRRSKSSAATPRRRCARARWRSRCATPCGSGSTTSRRRATRHARPTAFRDDCVIASRAMAHFEKAFAATLFAPIVAFIACSRESAAPAVTDAAPVVVSAPTASASAAPVVVNEAKITRYKDEAAMNVPVTVKHTPAAVLTAMPKGDVVAQLKVGDAVTQLAERNGYYRVTFADPTNAKQLLSGWLDKFAFVDRPTPPKKKVPTCTGDLILVMQGDMRCAKTCSDDAECPGGECEVAAILHADGEPPENHASTTVCTPKAAPAPSASACPAGLVRIVATGKPGGACVETCGSICSGGEDPVEATLLKDDGTPGAKVNVRPQASKPKLAQCGAGFARIVVSGQPGGACRLMCGSVCGGGENPVEATLLKDDGTPGGKVSVHP